MECLKGEGSLTKPALRKSYKDLYNLRNFPRAAVGVYTATMSRKMKKVFIKKPFMNANNLDVVVAPPYG